MEAALIEAALAGEARRRASSSGRSSCSSGAPERPVDERSRARALAFLARRGYDSELAYDAVRGFERRAA